VLFITILHESTAKATFNPPVSYRLGSYP